MIYPENERAYFEDKYETVFFLDLETTGLNPWQNEILTLSISACDIKTKTQINEFEIEMRPEFMNHWQDGAEKIHGISKDRALKFPPRSEGRDDLIEFLEFHKKATPQIFCCHALSFKGQGLFDWSFLYAEFFKAEKHFELFKYFHDIRSTINYAKEASSKGLIGFENNKLDTIAKHFNIPLDHHNAKSDRMACQEIYWRFHEL